MKLFLKGIWEGDRRRFLWILVLETMDALTGGVGIVMLIPLLTLLSIPSGSGNGWMRFLEPLIGKPGIQRFVLVLFIYLFLIILKSALTVLLTMNRQRLLEGEEMKLRNRVYEAISRADWERILHMKSGIMTELLVSRASAFGQGVQHVVMVFRTGLLILIQLAIALFIQPFITMGLLLFALLLLLLVRPFMKKTRSYGEEVIQVSRGFFSEIQEQIYSMKLIRSFGAEERHQERFKEKSKAFYDVHLHYIALRLAVRTIYSLGLFFLAAVVLAFGFLRRNTGSAEMIVLIYIISKLWPLFTEMQTMLQAIQSTVPSYLAVLEALRDLKPSAEIRVEKEAPKFSREIRFRHVSFRYGEASDKILRDINFTLRKGEILAIVGKSGGGKSTIADLLMGLLRPNQGSIEVDGVPIDCMNAHAWRKEIGYVPQESLILSGSLRENLERFHGTLEDEEIFRVMRMVGAEPLLTRLQYDLDAPLGERGICLSGGEKQRIMHARALLSHPSLLILDEASNALDAESCEAIQDMIRELKGKLTVLMISHRESSIRRADRILTLREGRLEEDEFAETERDG